MAHRHFHRAGWLRPLVLLSGLFLGARAQAQIIPPPPAPARPVTLTKFGVSVTDPYRWLEDAARPDVQEWYQLQDQHCTESLRHLLGRKNLLNRLQEMNPDRPYQITDIQRAGKLIFFQKLKPGEKSYSLWVRDGLAGVDKLLIAPEKDPLSAITLMRISSYAVSPNGQYVAYSLSNDQPGSGVLRILDTKTGKHTNPNEVLENARVEPSAWLPDNQGFIFSRLPSADPKQHLPANRLYLHRLTQKVGKQTKAFSDRLIFGQASGAEGAQELVARGGAMYAGGPLAVAYVAPRGSKYAEIFVSPVAELAQKIVPWRRVAAFEDEIITLYAHESYLYGLTNHDAPTGALVRTSLTAPNWPEATAVLEAPAPAVLDALHFSQGALYVTAHDGTAGQLWRIPLKPKNQAVPVPDPEPVTLPTGSAVAALACDPQRVDPLLTLHSWIAAPLVYRLIEGDELDETDLQPAADFDIPDHLAVVEVKVPGAGNTPVPLTMIYRRGLKLNALHPTILTAYGAYGRSLTPTYDPSCLAWIEKGGVLAIAHVRGGGEYGEPWHRAGQADNKTAAWQDFTACARHMIAKQYTTPALLAASAEGIGALVVGGAVLANPELFGALLLDRGICDAIRYDTLGRRPEDVQELGALGNEKGFKGRFAMSPYYRIQERTKYPAVLLNARAPASPDSVDWQLGKLAARLQDGGHAANPVLLRSEQYSRPGEERQRKLELIQDQYSFLLWQMDNTAFQPVTFSRRVRKARAAAPGTVAKGKGGGKSGAKSGKGKPVATARR